MNIETIKSLNHLKNASLANMEFSYLRHNKLVLYIIRFLYNEGFILSFKIIQDKTVLYDRYQIKICLRYLYNKPMFRSLKILSSSSRVSFLSYKDIVKLDSKKSLYCFSTSQGLLTALECKKKKLGGILLFVC